jgi:hypothetical protein
LHNSSIMRIPIYLHFLSIFQDNARFAFMWH